MAIAPEPKHSTTNVHGTTLALGQWAALITGPPGAGKSDLALRCLATGPNGLIPERPRLVSDDQTLLEHRDGWIYTLSPATIRGKLEVRGIGLVDIVPVDRARLVLIVDLSGRPTDRLPPVPLPTETILDQPIARIEIAPFEASAPLKVLLALKRLSNAAKPTDLNRARN
jgi:HPr kinase/phosphorylase